MKSGNVSDNATASAIVFKQRLGVVMCAAYALAYAGFVALSVYNVEIMDVVMPFGLNLATFYGFGLIIFALILAIIYSSACNARERSARNLNESSPANAKPDPGK